MSLVRRSLEGVSWVNNGFEGYVRGLFSLLLCVVFGGATGGLDAESLCHGEAGC